MSTRSTTGHKPACAHSATPPDAVSCPPPEALLALCSGHARLPADFSLLLHLSRCPACQSALSFVAAATGPLASCAETAPSAEVEPPPLEEADAGDPLLQAILQRFSPFAAAVFSGFAVPAAWSAGLSAGGSAFPGFGSLSGLGAALSAAALAKFALHFRANLSDSSPSYWIATLCIDPDDATRLAISISLPARHAPPPDGTFVLCGLSVPVAAGHATLSLADFRDNLSAGGVSFALPDSSPVSGTLSLSS